MERYCRYFEGALREAHANREIQIEQPRTKARELYAYLIGSMVQARIRNDTGILRQLSAGGVADPAVVCGSADSAEVSFRPTQGGSKSWSFGRLRYAAL